MTYIRTCGCQWGQDNEGESVQLATCLGHSTIFTKVAREYTTPDGRYDVTEFVCGCSGAHDLFKDRFQEGNTCPEHLVSERADFEPAP